MRTFLLHDHSFTIDYLQPISYNVYYRLLLELPAPPFVFVNKLQPVNNEALFSLENLYPGLLI
jgi:hypothetical protein